MRIFVSCRGGGCAYNPCATKRVGVATMTSFEKFRPKGAGDAASVISGK